jgi:excisionase family DNA binding protein
MKQIFTTGDAAKILRVAPRTVSKWFDSGKLRGYRVPGSQDRRIPRDQLVRFMKDHGIPVPEGLLDPEEAPAPEAAPEVAPEPARHSPGPWEVVTGLENFGPHYGYAGIVARRGGEGLDDEMVAEVNFSSRLRLAAPDDPMANARLIAAAPAMLAALEKVAAGGGPGAAEARAAVALAKGVA